MNMLILPTTECSAKDKEFNIYIEKDYDKTLKKINVVPQDISRVF